MKNTHIIFYSLFSILLTGCPIMPFDRFEVSFQPINVVNLYTDNIYLNDNFGINPNDNTLRFNQVQTISPCRGKCIENGYSEQVEFYQDANRNCFLFSIDNASAVGAFRDKQQKLASEFSLKAGNKAYISPSKEYDERIRIENGVVMVIDNGQIYPVSSEEFEQLRSTLKPRLYDPSLCKPKPAQVK